jgi:CheY-like chemotaxis protein
MSAPTPRSHILIAEDNFGDVSLIQMALADQGISLDTVVHGDGEKTMRYFDDVDAGQHPCPSLAIVDLHLPKIGGGEILDRIRRSELCGKIPVVIFSSSESKRDRKMAGDLGASVYLTKPGNLDDFLEVGKLFRKLLHPSTSASVS